MTKFPRVGMCAVLLASVPLNTATPQSLSGDLDNKTLAPCPPRDIESFDEASLGRAHCTEVTVHLTGTPNPAGQDDPPCVLNGQRPPDATYVGEDLDTALGGASGAIVWTLGGPATVPGAVASAVLAVAVGLTVEHNRRFKYAYCSTVCAKLPAGATNVHPVGWSGPFPSDPAHS